MNDDDDDVLLLDLNEEIAKNTKLSIAPGENKKPVPWLICPDIHELSFPKIYCGERFNLNKVSYTNRVKSELRRADRRSCTPDHVLYMGKEKQERQCFATLNVCLRKCIGDPNMTAGNVSKDGAIDNLVSHDAGFRVLKNIRSSTPYWEMRKKELMTLLRQLGKPAFFITLTANEKWSPELLQVLHKYHNDKDLTLKEALELFENVKTEMIRNDPVMCSRYFDHKCNAFVKIIKNENSIFGKYTITDSYERVESQQRGSGHEHIMIWAEGAPSLDMDNIEESEVKCIKFIDEFITCKNDSSIPIIGVQNHRLTHVINKRAKKESVDLEFRIQLWIEHEFSIH